MPIETSWIVENRLLEIKMIGHVTIQEYLQLNQEAIWILDELTHPLNALVDSTEMIDQPKLREMQRAKAHTHPMAGWLVEYGLQNDLLILMSNIMGRLTGIKYRQFATRQQALEFLCSVVPELENLLKDLPLSNDEPHRL